MQCVGEQDNPKPEVFGFGSAEKEETEYSDADDGVENPDCVETDDAGEPIGLKEVESLLEKRGISEARAGVPWTTAEIGREDGVMPDADRELDGFAGSNRREPAEERLAKAQAATRRHLAESTDLHPVSEDFVISEDRRKQQRKRLSC